MIEDIEMFIDEEDLEDGIQAISLVESPAIEENFIALKKHKVEFKTIDEEKRLIIGAVLVPDKKILRKEGDKEFNIFFSKETVRKAGELFLKRLKVNNATLEHQEKADGVSVVESWFVEDTKIDKSALHNLSLDVGTWAVIQRVDNDEIWADVKAGKYLGFSIEGFFSQELSEDKLIQQIKDILNEC